MNERLKHLNQKPVLKGEYVVYWMQQSQREEYNHALEYAIEQANNLGQPCVVFFGLTNKYPGANQRHYAFMLEGLLETEKLLGRRGIQMVIRLGPPEKEIAGFAEKASLVVTDRGYLTVQKKWRLFAAARLNCRLTQIESDVIVPVETASPKEEYTAGTFRPKFNRLVGEFAVPLKRKKLLHSSLKLNFGGFKYASAAEAFQKFKVNSNVKPVSWIKGGANSAKKQLASFIRERLELYEERNDPSTDYQSNLGPYLHFGQISPLYVFLEVSKSDNPGRDVFLEELAVRRELSMNFVHYNPNYSSINCLPDWARNTLRQHLGDKRPALYSLRQLENAQTHCPYWNAAQRQMAVLGKMHGYMRMYWGKKILEWTANPAEAFNHAVMLNDKFSLDGRDANGYAGVAWCFGKHDRAWSERAVFGKVRYMNDNGLERKFDMAAYLEQTATL